MCLIIASKAGAPMVDLDHIRASWLSGNDHGAGMAYVVDGVVMLHKPFWKLKHLVKAYRQVHKAYGATSPILVHLRFATHGAMNELNTHPHAICNGRGAMAHNGVLLDKIENPDHSDTVNYCHKFLCALAPEDIHDKLTIEAIESDIGPGNKFAIITDDGQLTICNPQCGTWIGETWYSNTSFRRWFSGRKSPCFEPGALSPTRGSTYLGGCYGGWDGGGWRREAAELGPPIRVPYQHARDFDTVPDAKEDAAADMADELAADEAAELEYPCVQCGTSFDDCRDEVMTANAAGIPGQAGACCAVCRHFARKSIHAESASFNRPAVRLLGPAGAKDEPVALESEEPRRDAPEVLRWGERMTSRVTINGETRYFLRINGREVTEAEAEAIERAADRIAEIQAEAEARRPGKVK